MSRKQTTTNEKSYVIRFLYWILWICVLSVWVFHWSMYLIKMKIENDRIERIKKLEEALVNNTLADEVSKQIKETSVLWEDWDKYYKDLNNSKEFNELNRLLNANTKNLDKILWEEVEKDIDLKDDYKNMSLRIESIWVFSPIMNTNWLTDEDYYKTIRTNTALKWSFPRMNWVTHISAHSSVPMYNKFWIQDIFKDLKNVKVWDKVEIFTEKYKYVYQVNEVTKKWFDNLWNVFDQTVRNKLVLMTCPDFWDKDFHTSREFAIWFLKDVQTLDWKSVFWFKEFEENEKKKEQLEKEIKENWEEKETWTWTINLLEQQ